MFGGASIRRNQNDLIAFFSVNQRTAIPCACFAALGREQHAGDTLPVVPFGSVGRDIGVDVLAHPLGRAVENGFGGSGVLGDHVAHDGERNLAGVKSVRKVQFSLLLAICGVVIVAGCSGSDSVTPSMTEAPQLPVASTSTTTSTTSTTTSTSTTTTTTLPPTELTTSIGTSVQSRSIDVIRELRALLPTEIPANVDLWLLPAINPDGVALNQRHNVNQVDLNRNFPYKWGIIAEPGNWEYSGPSSASEPETQATIEFVKYLRPDMTVWFHQDEFSIAPSTGSDGPLRREYARLTGLPLKGVPGGTYTGVAATWQRKTFVDDTAFIVELGPTMAEGEALTHARAILSVVSLLP
jgi:protein MpaA